MIKAGFVVSIVVTIVVSTSLGCSPQQVNVPVEMHTASLSTSATEVREVPASNAYMGIKNVLATGRGAEVALGVYTLAAPAPVGTRITNRAQTLGFQGAKSLASTEAHVARVSSGAWTLTVNEYSEGEEAVDPGRNHQGASVPEAALKSDQQFVAAAQAYAHKVLPDTALSASLYPYKVRKYFNAHSSGGTEVVDGVYQVAVAFNTTIDDLPVIGPGGKIAIEMVPSDMSVVRHETGLRRARAVVHLIRGDVDLVSPDDAEKKVNARLDGRGIDRSKFHVYRREFGYFAYGRKSIQTVLVPHYAFFFEPLPGTISKVLVEVEPATTDKAVLEAIAADRDAEVKRKLPTMATPTAKRG